MKYLLRLCKGIVRIRITGYSPERFINLCRNNDIELYHICVSGSGYEMETSAKNVFLLKKLLKKTGTKLKILDKVGLPFLLFHYRKHKFFLVGILSAFLCLLFMSQLLWEIEILGNYEITDEQFLKYLNSQNVYTGMSISNVDCEMLEEQIRNDYPDIAWVSARLEGTRLIFDVQELKKDTTLAEAEGETGSDLIASQDGVVTSIVTRNGTPLVTAGTEVVKGDILVSGCNELFDDYGTIIGYKYCKADADVLIESQITYQDTIEVEYDKKQLTEKNRWSITFMFPQKQLTLGIVKNPYENYQITTEEKPLKIGKRITFPVTIQLCKTEELEITKSLYTEAEIESIAKRNFALYSKKMEKKGFHIIDKNGKIKVSDKQVLVTGMITFQYMETERKDTPVKTLEAEEGLEQNGIDADSNGNSS